MNYRPIIIIMAGGRGSRMNSSLPKVLHKIDGLPMLYRVIIQARLVNPYKIFVVVGSNKSIIESTLQEYTSLDDIEFKDQPQPLGTGHAIMCCRTDLLKYCNTNTKILILSGDIPLIQSSTMIAMLDCSFVNIMTTIMNLPYGYGRICEIDGIFHKIIEEKDCTDQQRAITKINCGIYSFDCNVLCRYLPFIKNNNAQSEYYLTDIFEIIKNNENKSINMYNVPETNQLEIIGVNTEEQLKDLSNRFKNIVPSQFLF